MTETILNKPVMWVSMPPTHGAFLICMAMCGSGPRTGTKRRIPPATRWLIPLDRHRARIGSDGVVPGTTTGRTCVLLSAAPTPQHPHQHPWLPCWFPTAVVWELCTKGAGHCQRERRSGTGLDQKGHARDAKPAV